MISIIVPTYNEINNIIPLVNAIHIELKGYKHEIIVVDDNSPDGTFNKIKSLRLPYVKLILRKKDRSLGKCIGSGIKSSEGKFLVVMDSDFNHKPYYLPRMIDNLVYYDCVLGSRFVYGGGMSSYFRDLFSWMFNIFLRIILRGSITDNLSGFFAIKRDLVDLLDYEKIFYGYGDYYFRLLFYLQKENVKILQIPVIYGKRLSGSGNSLFGLANALCKYLFEALKLTFKK